MALRRLGWRGEPDVLVKISKLTIVKIDFLVQRSKEIFVVGHLFLHGNSSNLDEELEVFEHRPDDGWRATLNPLAQRDLASDSR